MCSFRTVRSAGRHALIALFVITVLFGTLAAAAPAKYGCMTRGHPSNSTCAMPQPGDCRNATGGAANGSMIHCNATQPYLNTTALDYGITVSDPDHADSTTDELSQGLPDSSKKARLPPVPMPKSYGCMGCSHSSAAVVHASQIMITIPLLVAVNAYLS
ncbi:uncharacterized protein JN550_005792 [Neoarthrinium moseri]|uniref:uncharacterized protein n=1 Tax=Neoarthrinium moseri TaxID=1658444 RepID=UPI001FDC0BA3|nr:uncharacterized protein JN550_005792 [Neoarthrinium moseri]KAI1869811.1 hypothetical protein JN550_005792 [Neoarthrinium moseri]